MITYAADGHILLTTLLQELCNNTLLLELKVHLGLVGLDLDQDITGRNGVSGLLLPSTNVSRSHGRRQSGHLDNSVRRERGVPSCQLRRDGDSGGRKGLPSQDGAEHDGQGGCCGGGRIKKKYISRPGGRRRQLVRRGLPNNRLVDKARVRYE